MKIDIMSKNYEAKERLTNVIEKKVARLEKFLGKNASCKVLLSQTKDRYKMEVTINADGRFIRSEVESDNMYANVDLCLAKVERQIIKYGDKIKSFKRQSLDELSFFDEIPVFKKNKIVKRKSYELVPMTEEQAMEEMDLVGHDFFVFNNKKTGTVCVLYKREEGDFGIIETK